MWASLVSSFCSVFAQRVFGGFFRFRGYISRGACIFHSLGGMGKVVWAVIWIRHFLCIQFPQDQPSHKPFLTEALMCLELLFDALEQFGGYPVSDGATFPSATHVPAEFRDLTRVPSGQFIFNQPQNKRLLRELFAVFPMGIQILFQPLVQFLRDLAAQSAVPGLPVESGEVFRQHPGQIFTVGDVRPLILQHTPVQ